MKKTAQITGAQIRAARGLLKWSQHELASAAGIGVTTLKEIESDKGRAKPENFAAAISTIEAHGVVFDLRAGKGPGVRFSERKSHDDHERKGVDGSV